jgi:hypothetical protein
MVEKWKGGLAVRPVVVGNPCRLWDSPCITLQGHEYGGIVRSCCISVDRFVSRGSHITYR